MGKAGAPVLAEGLRELGWCSLEMGGFGGT